MERVKCPECQQMVPLAAHCMECGARIPERASEMGEEHFAESAVSRTRSAEDDLKKVVLARVLIGKQLPDGTFPGMKRLVVQPTERAVLMADGHDPVVLGPGQYSVSGAGVGATPFQAFMAQVRGSLVSICRVVNTVFPATFILPDWKSVVDHSCDHGADIRRAYESISLRTADNLLGGVDVRFELSCLDPSRLLKNLVLLDDDFEDHAEKYRAVRGEERRPKGAGRAATYPVQLLWNFIAGGKPGDHSSVDPFNFTVADLYQRIRNELAQAVRAAIRSETAESLYNTVEVRDRVAADIAKSMDRSFDRFGLDLEQISAFRFNSPDYDRLLGKRGQIAIEQAEIEDRQTRAAIGERARVISADEARHVTATQEETERRRLDEEGRTSEARDKLAREAQNRQMASEGDRRSFTRSQEAADVRQANELQLEKIEAHAQVNMKYQQATVEQQVRLIETLSKLPPDRILPTALMLNPQLKEAFVAAKAAEGYQQQVQMQERFRDSLVQVLGGADRTMINGLMGEAVKQFGHVLAKKAEAARPQIIATPGGGMIVPVASDPQPPQPVDRVDDEAEQQTVDASEESRQVKSTT